MSSKPGDDHGSVQTRVGGEFQEREKAKVSTLTKSHNRDMRAFTLRLENLEVQKKLADRIDDLDEELVETKRLALTLPTPATTSSFGLNMTCSPAHVTSPSPLGASAMVPQAKLLSEEEKTRLRETSHFLLGMNQCRRLQARATMRVDEFDWVGSDSDCLDKGTWVFRTPVKGTYKLGCFNPFMAGFGSYRTKISPVFGCYMTDFCSFHLEISHCDVPQ